MLKSDPKILNKTFSWSYDEKSRQDAVVVRICVNNETKTCVFEKRLFSQGPPTEITIVPLFGNREYVAYAIAQSNGISSSPSTAITFKVGKL